MCMQDAGLHYKSAQQSLGLDLPVSAASFASSSMGAVVICLSVLCEGRLRFCREQSTELSLPRSVGSSGGLGASCHGGNRWRTKTPGSRAATSACCVSVCSVLRPCRGCTGRGAPDGGPLRQSRVQSAERGCLGRCGCGRGDGAVQAGRETAEAQAGGSRGRCQQHACSTHCSACMAALQYATRRSRFVASAGLARSGWDDVGDGSQVPLPSALSRLLQTLPALPPRLVSFEALPAAPPSIPMSVWLLSVIAQLHISTPSCMRAPFYALQCPENRRLERQKEDRDADGRWQKKMAQVSSRHFSEDAPRPTCEP